MNSHQKLLAARRQQLVARCALQREAMSIQRIRLQQSLATLDTGMRVLQRLRSAPGLALALVGGLLLLRPRRLQPLVRGALAAVRGWRLVAPLVGALLAARRQHESTTSRARIPRPARGCATPPP